MGVLASVLAPRVAAAEATGALERFEPAPAGDALFGVPSASAGGHLVPRTAAIFDYAYKPLSIEDQNGQRYVIVSRQAFLHADLSLALWDRLLLSVDVPFALLQAGDSPTVAGTTFASPSGAQFGDVRFGARAAIYGGYWDPFQVGVGGYVWTPTASKGSFAGESTRGQPQLVLGGRTAHSVWNLALGTTLRRSTHPHTFDAGAGAALVLGDDSFFQIGPELTVSAPLAKDKSFSTANAVIENTPPTAAELLLGAKVRPIRSFVVGAGAGPGLTHGYGTPAMFAVASIGYDPLPPRHVDRDADGIDDGEDACPDVRGVRDADPTKNGCPADRDGDGVIDEEDACPTVQGVRDRDPKKNGCPADRDGDDIADDEDACPDTKGPRNDDPTKNGCPADRDQDRIADDVDACPDAKGEPSDDPKKNGCPPDRDGDEIPDATDACPDEKGSADPDPKKNGCPHVAVTDTAIEITSQVHFRHGRSSLDQTVDPISDGLLREIRDAIQNHPEIEHIEVEGHADTTGDERWNVVLSRARADAVRRWLVERGVPAAKLTAQGYGSRVPRAPNTSETGRAENRRVQFRIIVGGGD